MTKNKFYNDFDFERLESNSIDEYRTHFQVDRDRIIHSSEFRRLQGKTQVFLPGEYDFYRTRLTHSIEVSQIGRSICNYLKFKQNDIFSDEYYIDADLVETACLSHDLGNPPFGHPGERKINELMRSYSGYEGNAQTLRILTEIFYKRENKRKGMNPCRATLDSILKYKKLYSEFPTPPENHFLYDFQKKYVNFVFNNLPVPENIDLNKFKSIECQIMDWSDDTAYAINDLTDSISGGFINILKLEKWGEENNSKLTPLQKSYLLEMIGEIKKGTFKRFFGSQIGDFIKSCKIVEQETFMNELTNRYKLKLVINDAVLEKVELYKKISFQLVFESPQLYQMEFKGGSMIEKIFNVLQDNYITHPRERKLLSEFTDKLLRKSETDFDKIRIICDYISGMTDNYAMRTYKRLFDPDYSSLVDLI